MEVTILNVTELCILIGEIKTPSQAARDLYGGLLRDFRKVNEKGGGGKYAKELYRIFSTTVLPYQSVFKIPYQNEGLILGIRTKQNSELNFMRS